MTKNRRHPTGVSSICRPCRQRRRRGLDRPDGIRASNRAIEALADPDPAALLRLELADLRADGWSFADAWPIAVEFALSDVSDRRERRTWREVLHDTADDWQAAYDRQGAPQGRTMRLAPGDADALAVA